MPKPHGQTPMTVTGDHPREKKRSVKLRTPTRTVKGVKLYAPNVDKEGTYHSGNKRVLEMFRLERLAKVEAGEAHPHPRPRFWTQEA